MENSYLYLMRLLEKKKNISLDKENEVFCNIFAERTEEIEKFDNSVNFQILIYNFKGPTKNIDFNDFIDARTHFDDIKSKKIRFDDVQKHQMEFELK